MEINICRKKERHREGEMLLVRAHSSDFLFVVFLSLFYLLLYLLLSSLHSEKTNKNNRDTPGWRGGKIPIISNSSCATEIT